MPESSCLMLKGICTGYFKNSNPGPSQELNKIRTNWPVKYFKATSQILKTSEHTLAIFQQKKERKYPFSIYVLTYFKDLPFCYIQPNISSQFSKNYIIILLSSYESAFSNLKDNFLSHKSLLRTFITNTNSATFFECQTNRISLKSAIVTYFVHISKNVLQVLVLQTLV